MKTLALLLCGGLLAPAATHYVTVAGLGGEAEYEQRFETLAKDIDKLVRATAGGGRVETLYGAQATKAKLSEALGAIGKAAAAQDALVVMLIGHGTFDGIEYKFNLPGPDVGSIELASLLDRVPGQQLVVNMTSCSGGSAAALMKEGRAVITATKNGGEKNATVFARYWAEALRDAAADSDKNEVISALEAFKYATEKTQRFYDTQKRLSTEHSQIEDTGKGEPTRTPGPDNGQGLLAGKFALLRLGSVQAAAATPGKRALLEKKEQLEQKIDQLKYARAAMPTDPYKKQLAALLLELAQTQEELDK